MLSQILHLQHQLSGHQECRMRKNPSHFWNHFLSAIFSNLIAPQPSMSLQIFALPPQADILIVYHAFFQPFIFWQVSFNYIDMQPSTLLWTSWPTFWGRMRIIFGLGFSFGMNQTKINRLMSLFNCIQSLFFLRGLCCAFTAPLCLSLWNKNWLIKIKANSTINVCKMEGACKGQSML